MGYTSKSIKEIEIWLKENLTEEKYYHSLGTMKCAIGLAERFNLDTEKAQIAGLLHDCAKNFDKSKLIELVDKCNTEIFPREISAPKVLHAPIGAYVAKEIFGVTDEEILSAIRFHTIARINMSDFEKIIFIADKIETETREKELHDKVTELLDKENGLNSAMCFLLERTIKYLNTKQIKPDQSTIDICNWFMKK